MVITNSKNLQVFSRNVGTKHGHCSVFLKKQKKNKQGLNKTEQKQNRSTKNRIPVSVSDLFFGKNRKQLFLIKKQLFKQLFLIKNYTCHGQCFSVAVTLLRKPSTLGAFFPQKRAVFLIQGRKIVCAHKYRYHFFLYGYFSSIFPFRKYTFMFIIHTS